MPDLEALLNLPEHAVLKSRFDDTRSSLNGLGGIRLLHLNAVDKGGGVAEQNPSLILALRNLGINADWLQINRLLEKQVPKALVDDYFSFTKGMHNRLQGDESLRGMGGLEEYIYVNGKLTEVINFALYDVVIIDDPQPLAAEHFARKILGDRREEQKWIFRCHIDPTKPETEALELVAKYLRGYDAAIFTSPASVPEQLKTGIPLFYMKPGINPLSVKNTVMTREDAYQILSNNGINLDINRPTVAQVSRFDPWKNPEGVIDAYLIAKQRIPGLQLLLMASGAADDPEGEIMYKRVLAKAGNDRDIFVFLNTDSEMNDLVTGAAQNYADIILQNSIREGFGLVIAEALWKHKPVIATNVGGIPLQIRHNENGLLVPPDTPQELADAVAHLYENPEIAQRLSANARQGVVTALDVALGYVPVLTAFLKTPQTSYEIQQSNGSLAHLPA